MAETYNSKGMYPTRARFIGIAEPGTRQFTCGLFDVLPCRDSLKFFYDTSAIKRAHTGDDCMLAFEVNPELAHGCDICGTKIPVGSRVFVYVRPGWAAFTANGWSFKKLVLCQDCDCEKVRTVKCCENHFRIEV